MADDKVIKLLHTGAEVISGGAGAALGLALASPIGAVVAGSTAPLAEHALKSLLGDVASREMSNRETYRVGTAAAHALNRIYGKLMAGETRRDDGFFQSSDDDRSPAETAFEGVLMKCKTQWEEKKVPWLGNIYANAEFGDVPFEIINRVIVLADRMTWRQLCILALVGQDVSGTNARWIMYSPANMSGEQTVLLGEALDLFEAQYRFFKTAPLGLTPMGQACFDMMSLDELPSQEMVEICLLFNGHYVTSQSHEHREYD